MVTHTPPDPHKILPKDIPRKTWMIPLHPQTIVLWMMGYTNEHQYFSSDLWKSIKERVLPDYVVCKRCSGEFYALRVMRHEVCDYNGTCLDYLEPLCRHCSQKRYDTMMNDVMARALHGTIHN